MSARSREGCSAGLPNKAVMSAVEELTDEMKADEHNSDVEPMPRPPMRVGRHSCNLAELSRRMLQMDERASQMALSIDVSDSCSVNAGHVRSV